MNKYKEAFDYVDKILGQNICVNCSHKGECEGCNLCEQVKILEELVDNYGDYMSYQDLKAEYELKIANLEKQIGTDEEIFGGK